MDSINEIKNMWRIVLPNEASVLELRAIWPAGMSSKVPPLTCHFRAADYPTLDECTGAFEVTALRLNEDGFNIYIVMNPIDSNFHGAAVKDSDITCRKLLLIDIDRVEKKTEPATDEEVDAAGVLAEEVIAYLEQLDWPKPTRVMSGNGHHLYYKLPETPNTPEAKNQIQQLLLKLANKFDNETVKIDTVVFNASRITKVVGTIARKGFESEGRPYRMARVL
jgi:hypothetical protein